MSKTAPPKSKSQNKKPTKVELATARESARDKKARQRAAKRASGLVEVSVWVAPDHAEAVRDFAATLPVPRRETVSHEPTLFDGMI